MKVWSTSPLFAAFCLTLGACASSLPAAREPARGLIDLNARVPTLPTHPSPYGAAYGGETGLRASTNTPDLEPYLKAPDPRKKKTDVPTAAVASAERRAMPAPAAELPVPAQAPVATPSKPEERPLFASSLDAPSRSAPGGADDAQRYAAREQQNQGLEQFRGGDAIIITSGALVVILLVVILILLLT